MTTITTRTHERWIIRAQRVRSPVAECIECRAQADWLSLAAACELGGTTLPEIFESIKTGLIHASTTREGHVVVCAASLGIKQIKGDKENDC